MKYRLFHTEENFPTLKKKEITLSIVLGLFYSFTFYSFLYISRETIRLLSITDEYDIWILSDKEVNFYNLFFAFLSLIFAQSICLSQWFGKSRRKSAIINDQLCLNNFFLCWFSQLAILYGLFFGIPGMGGFYVFSFYPKYNYLFIFILIVLFLQTWRSIRRIYKRKALKWMLYSAVIISILAFSLSRINLVDYRRINHICLEKNIAHKYNLELAEIETFDDYLPTYRNSIYIDRKSVV